jgi:hypothetical protein
MVPITYGSRKVTFARCVLSQLDVAWPKVNLFSSGHFNLFLTGESKGVLAAWSNMPLVNRAWSNAVQFRSRG